MLTIYALLAENHRAINITDELGIQTRLSDSLSVRHILEEIYYDIEKSVVPAELD